jgi:hypothetical protein
MTTVITEDRAREILEIPWINGNLVGFEEVSIDIYI